MTGRLDERRIARSGVVFRSRLPHLHWRARCVCLWGGRDYPTQQVALHALCQHLTHAARTSP